jgi:hypothetical protein
MAEQIDPNREYRPMEIVNLGFIKNTKGSGGYGAYNFVLNLIRAGKIKARNVGMGKVPHFMVKGEDIIKYLTSY